MQPCPAAVGMRLEDVDTPCLVIELDSFERNLLALRDFVERSGVRLRAHAKTHKCFEIARRQIEQGGACGVCCQKVSEAEALVGAGLTDVLVSNEITSARMLERLALLARRARMIVCVDDIDNVSALSAAAAAKDVTIECLVEIDVGADRCGVEPGMPAVVLAKAISGAPGLKFSGLQAYNGPAQHFGDYSERSRAIRASIVQTGETVSLLRNHGLECSIVGGAGTGSFRIEGRSGVFNELQCGSYIFMDAAYNRIQDETGAPASDFESSLFLYTSVMSKTTPNKAVCDAGLKAQSVDSGLPEVFGRTDIRYVRCSDEHGILDDPGNVLRLNEKIKLIPGHCDPTVNIHDWFVAVRNGRVEALWPITARGAFL